MGPSLAFLYPNVYYLKRNLQGNENADPWVGVRDDSVFEERLSFVKGLQALGTYIEFASLAVHHHRPFSHIRPELAIGVPLGKADVMPELRTLAAYFTLSH
jgi:hypothetical protein